MTKQPQSILHLWPVIIGLGVTQMIGWGTSFTALSVLGSPIARDLGLSRLQAFSGISFTLLVSAALAPQLGRRIDADGARTLMLLGPLAGAVSMLVIAVSQGPLSYWFGWSIFGLVVAMMLNNAAVPALPAHLEAARRTYRAQSRAQRTLEAYGRACGLFTRWCEKHAHQPLPAAPETIEAWIVALAHGDGEPPRSRATIDQYLSAVVWAHRKAGHALDRKHPLIAETWAGICRNKAKAGAARKKRAVKEKKIFLQTDQCAMM